MVGRVAHSVRGSSAAMGAVRLSETCGEVEVAVRTEEELDLASVRDRMATEAREAVAELVALHRPPAPS